MRDWKTVVQVLLLGTLAGLTGCDESGPKLGKVTGTITLDGAPVAKLRVEFQPTENGSPSYGTTDDEGKYELLYTPTRKGAMLGSHTVRITGRYYDPVSQAMKTAVDVPERYNVESELAYEVSKGKNIADFELTSD